MYHYLKEDYIAYIPEAPEVPQAPEALIAPQQINNNDVKKIKETFAQHVWKLIQAVPIPSHDTPIPSWVSTSLPFIRNQLDSTYIENSFLFERSTEYRLHHICLLIHFIYFDNNHTLFREWLHSIPVRYFRDYYESVYIARTLQTALQNKQFERQCSLAYNQTTPPQRNQLTNYLKRQHYSVTALELFQEVYHSTNADSDDQLKVLLFLMPRFVDWTTNDFGIVNQLVQLCHMRRWIVLLLDILKSTKPVFSDEQINEWYQNKTPITCQTVCGPLFMRLKCL